MILIAFNLKHISYKPEVSQFKESRHYKYFIGFLWEMLMIELSFQVYLFLANIIHMLFIIEEWNENP